MTKEENALKQKIVTIIGDIQEKMCDRSFKKHLEYQIKEILEIFKSKDLKENTEHITKIFKKNVSNENIETKLSSLLFVFTILSQIPEKSKNDYSFFLDQVEMELAPSAFNLLCVLIKEESNKNASQVNTYKMNLNVITILTILTFFNFCQSRFSTAKGQKPRKFDTFTKNLEIPDKLNKKFDAYSNISMNLLDARTNYFETSEAIDNIDFQSKLETLLWSIAKIRKNLRSTLNAKMDEKEYIEFNEYLDAYQSKLLELSELIKNKTKFIPDSSQDKIHKEEEFVKFLLEGLPNIMENEGWENTERMARYIIDFYNKVFDEMEVAPGLSRAQSFKMPEIKTTLAKNRDNQNNQSEIFEENSNLNIENSFPREVFPEEVKMNTNKLQLPRNSYKDASKDVQILTEKSVKNFSNLFDKPLQNSSNKNSHRMEVIGAEEDHFHQRNKSIAISIDSKQNPSPRIGNHSAEVQAKIKKFEDVFNETHDMDLMKDSTVNRASYHSGFNTLPMKNSKLLNISGIDKKSSSSFMEGRSIVKMTFGASKFGAKADPNNSGDRKNIIGDAFSRVSTLMNPKRLSQGAIKPFGQNEMVKNQPQDNENRNILTSSISPVQPASIKTKDEQLLPFSPVYENKNEQTNKKPSLTEFVIKTPTLGLVEGHMDDNKVFDFNDFNSANSDKLETPPEQSLRDHSNILPPSLKGLGGIKINSINAFGNQMNETNQEGNQGFENQFTTALNKNSKEHIIGKVDQANKNFEGFLPKRNTRDRETMRNFDDPNYSAIGPDMNGSRNSFKNDISDNYSQFVIDENIINDKIELERNINMQKQQFQTLLDKMKTSESGKSKADNDHQREMELYKQFIQKITADYENLLANNKQETKELRIIIEEITSQNEKYKHKTFNAENEIIGYKEENERLKKYFASQKLKYEQNIAKQKEQILKTMESKIAAIERSSAEKVRSLTENNTSEIYKLKTVNHDLEIEVNNLRLEIESIKNEKLNDVYSLKEKIQQLRQLSIQLKSDYDLASYKVNSILESKKLKHSGLLSQAHFLAQNELLEKLKNEQKKNDELRKQMLIGGNESNVMRSNLTFTNRLNSLVEQHTEKNGIHTNLNNLRESVQKFEMWITRSIRCLVSDISAFSKQSKTKVSKQVEKIKNLNQIQMKELSKLKFQNELLAQDYAHLKEKNKQLLEETQILKKELNEAKKELVVPKRTGFDTEMMKKYRQLQLENVSLNDLNKRNMDEILQLTEKIILAETENSCSEKFMTALKKLEAENEELMEVNKALYNEIYLSKSQHVQNDSTRSQYQAMRKEIDQLKYLNNQLMSRVPNNVHNQNIMVLNANVNQILNSEINHKKYSNVTGSAFIKKIDILMDHLSAKEPTSTPKSIVDWIAEHSQEQQSQIAQICTASKYYLVKTEAFKLHVSEKVLFLGSEITISAGLTFSNMTNSQIGIESFKITCESRHAVIEEKQPIDIILSAYEEHFFSIKVVLDPNYLYCIQPIFVSFNMFGKPFNRQDFSSKKEGKNSSFHFIPFPITINKLVSTQKEDLSKFTIIHSLQTVGEIIVEDQKNLQLEQLLDLFPDLCEISAEDNIFGIKINSFFGMFFMTIVLDPNSGVNLKLFAMFKSPLHETFIKTIAFIIDNF